MTSHETNERGERAPRRKLAPPARFEAWAGLWTFTFFLLSSSLEDRSYRTYKTCKTYPQAKRRASDSQWRNRNSLALSSAHWTSSHALRLSAPLFTWPSATWTSSALGSRESVARYISLSI